MLDVAISRYPSPGGKSQNIPVFNREKLKEMIKIQLVPGDSERINLDIFEKKKITEKLPLLIQQFKKNA
jgi:hypothetical protein